MVKRELLIFLLLFVFLALGMHYHACFTNPVGHLESLPKSPLGIYHPFWLTAGIYMIILMIRISVSIVKKIVK